MKKVELSELADGPFGTPNNAQPHAPEQMTLLRMRRDPIVLGGIFINITQALYSEEHNLLGSMGRPWRPDKDMDGKHIALSDEWTPKDPNPRPAILISVGDLAYDDKILQGLDKTAGYDMKNDITTQARQVTGTAHWVHLGRSRGQAEQYACCTLDLLDAFSFVIRRDFCFESFSVATILKPKKTKEEPQEWECRVVVQFKFQDIFELRRESSILKSISISSMTPFTTDLLR